MGLPLPRSRSLKTEFVVHELEGVADLTEEQLVVRLRELFTSPSYRAPSLPKVALELGNLASRPNVQTRDVVKLLEQDPMLSGALLKIVNSALYTARTPIQTLHQAVVRLGLDTVKNLVMEAALNVRVFRAEGYSEVMDQVRVHSSLTAHFSRLIARYTSFDGEVAFSIGLLHDVGIAAALIALSEAKPRPRLADVWNALERVHSESGNILLDLWKVTPEMALVIRNHHEAKVAGHVHPMVAILSLAEQLAADTGAGIDPNKLGKGGKLGGSVGEGVPAIPEHTAWTTLRIDERQWSLIRADASKIVQAMSAGPAAPAAPPR